MKNTYKNLIILLFILTVSFSVSSQNNEIKIKFIGNCGLHITDGELNIYSDFPYKSGAYGYMEFDESELENIAENSIFIFTHKHADHYSGKNMRRVLKKKDGQEFGPSSIKKLQKFAQNTPDFQIEVFKTQHRFSFNHYSYLITWHGKKIFLSGDTESAETIRKLKDLDWAFIPYWILYDAKEKDIKIDTKNIGLYHLYPNQRMEGEIPDKMLVLKEQNVIISIPY